ncbi:MAG TPA: glycoside hydrolase family 95 protein [Pyrinomonadaceae bacterium]|nr:glycoside hydrolase family 95 protein [Pyrinomonadaceae bacterium]
MKRLFVLLFLILPFQLFSQTQSVGVDTFDGKFQNESASPNEKLSLWYRQPAKVWTEALPIGNGRLGAMIFGGIEGERIQLNEDTLWGGSPYNPANPEALKALPEVRKLVFAGKYKEAEALIQEKMMSKPIKQMPYQTIGDLRLAFPKVAEVLDYRRELNIDKAISTVTYQTGGVRFTREMFATALDNVIVIRLTADKKGQISFSAAMQTPQKGSVKVENNTLILDGKNGSSSGIEGKLNFQTRVLLNNLGGNIDENCGDDKPLFAEYSPIGKNDAAPPIQKSCLSVKNADSVLIFISAATSYKNYDDISADQITKAKLPITAASAKSYENLKTTHIADYQKYFRRVSLNLGEGSNLPTDERIKNFATSNDPDFAALYFQFGRYLLISSSRPKSQPANLQGIWNDSMSPPWNSKYTININTEMNYWLSEPTNLSEMTEPLFDLIADISKTGAVTAKTNYGARGWVTHHNTDIWRATGPIDSAFYGTWSTGGAWLTTHLWDHYEYTGDKKFLAKIYPILKGASEFFVDYLIEDYNGYLVTNPTMSPENRHLFDTSIAAGTTMDSQIICDLFANTIKASEILKKDPDFAKILAKKQAKLPPNKIGKAGQLQEWLEDWDLEAKDLHHRHVSHLYGAFPSWQINANDTPELTNAVKKTLEMRGDDSTGWAIGWRLNLWARLRDAEHAYKILELLLRPERTYPNMFDAHPPFQIDGNLGGTNGIAEMLMQNRLKDDVVEIYLLPALPKKFSNGAITGLQARNNITIDLKWQNGKIVSATMKSLNKTKAKVFYNGEKREIVLSPNKIWKW